MKLHRSVLVAIPILLSAFLLAQQPPDNPLLRDLALPSDRAISRRPLGSRRRRSLRAQDVLLRRDWRRRVEDHRRGTLVDSHLRRLLQDRLRGRHRSRRFRPQHDLRRHGRSLRARQRLERRRRLQIHRWRRDLAQRRPRADVPHRRGCRSSQESGYRLRRGAGPSLGTERRARRLSHDRRRPNLEAGADARSGSRRGRISRWTRRIPRVLYAAFWQISRKPWRIDSGGPGSGLWKSTDGGDTWQDLSHAPGMPRGVEGRIGITVSPANPERV